MKITIEDINFLNSLYKMRCLSFDEIHSFFYTQNTWYKEKIIPLIQNKLCTFHYVGCQYALMITQKGIDLVKRYSNLPAETYNINTKKIEKCFLKERDVIVEEKFANHQIALNEFVLEFKKQKGDIEYYDEKFLSNSGLSNIRPDGMIRLENNIDLFLEQDMGTESSKQLLEKWARYRRFLEQEYNGNRKIIVLFIIKCQKVKERDLLVRKTILESFSQLMLNSFDVYMGTKEEMLKACFDRIIPGDKTRTQEFAVLMKRHKLDIMDGSKLKARMGGVVYRYYFKGLDKQGRLTYYCPNRRKKGRFLEFLADNYDYEPMTVLSKIRFHDKNSHNFDIAYSNKPNMRLIGYIVLTRNIQSLYKDLKACDLLNINNVFFTTPERLRTMPLPKALMRFDENGNVFTCGDYYFEATIREGTLISHNEKGLIETI